MRLFLYCKDIWIRSACNDVRKVSGQETGQSMNSEKLVFTYEDTGEQVEFFIVEQTKVNGISYILVTDSEEEDAECLILKDTSAPQDTDSIYEIVEDETELLAVLKVFEELLEDIDIEM